MVVAGEASEVQTEDSRKISKQIRSYRRRRRKRKKSSLRVWLSHDGVSYRKCSRLGSEFRQISGVK